jgi:hypothetical protein
MVAYSFDKRFVGPIATATKRQTIRGDRKRHARPGEVVQLYTAMRTRYCRPIGTARCVNVGRITLDFTVPRVSYDLGSGKMIIFAPRLDAFARSDGFENWAEMRAFWAARYPGLSVFEGWIIQWAEFSVASVVENRQNESEMRKNFCG